MWDTFCSHSAYIQITFEACQGQAQNLTFTQRMVLYSNFRAFQNLVSEHSIAGVPASLYNLTKSVPDPLCIRAL